MDDLLYDLHSTQQKKQTQLLFIIARHLENLVYLQSLATHALIPEAEQVCNHMTQETQTLSKHLDKLQNILKG